MPQYAPPLRDMQFVMHEVFKVTDEFKSIPKHAEIDRELAAFFQHCIDGVGINVGMRWQDLQLVGDLEHFVQDELHVAQGWGVLGHGYSLA